MSATIPCVVCAKRSAKSSMFKSQYCRRHHAVVMVVEFMRALGLTQRDLDELREWAESPAPQKPEGEQ